MCVAPCGAVFGQHKGTALEFSVAMRDEEVRRQCRMAFARVDQQKQNFEKRMKKQAVSARSYCVLVMFAANDTVLLVLPPLAV